MIGCAYFFRLPLVSSWPSTEPANVFTCLTVAFAVLSTVPAIDEVLSAVCFFGKADFFAAGFCAGFFATEVDFLAGAFAGFVATDVAFFTGAFATAFAGDFLDMVSWLSASWLSVS